MSKQAPSQLLRDPGISFGRFRVLTRMDGKHIVYDPDRQLGARTVDVFDLLADASKRCERMAKEEGFT